MPLLFFDSAELEGKDHLRGLDDITAVVHRALLQISVRFRLRHMMALHEQRFGLLDHLPFFFASLSLAATSGVTSGSDAHDQELHGGEEFAGFDGHREKDDIIGDVFDL